MAISLYIKLISVEFIDENSLTIISLLLSPNLKRFISIPKFLSLLKILTKKQNVFIVKSKVPFEFLVYLELQN